MSVFEVAVLVVTVIGNVLIGLFSLRRNPRSSTYRIFTLLSFAFAAWAVVTFFAVNAQTEIAALWVTRFVMFLAVPQAVLFMLLMHTFPRTTLAMSRRSLFAIIIVGGAVAVLTLTPLVFETVELVPGSAPQPKPGVGMLAFVPLAVGSVVAGFYFLIRKNISSRGLERTQSRYLLVGALIMFTLIIALNFFGVAFLKQSSLATYGPLFTLPFVGLTAYAIIRHRLLDIKAAIFRGLSLSFLIGGVLTIYGLLLIFAVPSIANVTNISADIVAGAAALASIPLARYVQKTLTRITDKFLFQSRADYQKALVEIGDQLSGTIEIDDVTNAVLKAMKEIVRSKKTIIFLQEAEDKEFRPRATDGVRNLRVTIPHDHVLLEHLRHAAGPLVKDELALTKEQEQRPRHIEELEEIENALTWLDAAVVLPLFVNKELTGIIALGDKLSGEPYLQDDTNFLASLAPQAATALENARLYQESLEFGEKLKVEVERATRELAVANEQLRDLDKAKSEFLSVASHQLYTPLTALRGYLSMLREGDYGTTPPKQKPIIDILEQSSERLITLIKSLLDISRIESGRLELNLESINLAEMVQELVTDLLPNAKAKKLGLEFEEPDQQLSHVVADRQRLRQVMLNFIDNAIKYTNHGRVDVTLRQLGDEIIFAVTDTGKGLTQKEITKLFNKFTRVGGADRFHTEGTGLGLYVAKQIVEEHHGRVEVESPGTDKGSTFSMHLPVEGSPRSLKAGEEASVEIKAAA